MTFKQLSDDNLALIKEYASDKIGVHPTAALIKTLDFQFVDTIGNVSYTNVGATGMDYFIVNSRFWRRSIFPDSLQFYHETFDERNFPQHFDIDLVRDNLRQQDEIEAMGREDARLYPEGMPESDKTHGWGWLNDRAG